MTAEAQVDSVSQLLQDYQDVFVADTQLPMHKADKCKTAFATRNSLYKFNTMPFGLCNTLASRLFSEALTVRYVWYTSMTLSWEDRLPQRRSDASV
jgi:hypothetical protein